MMNSDEISKFINCSHALLSNYKHKGRYYHTLKATDNSPTVVHKETNQFTYVISGNGLVYLNGVCKKLHANDQIFIEANTTHRFIAQSKELTLFHIHIPDEGRDYDRYIVEGEDYGRYEI